MTAVHCNRNFHWKCINSKSPQASLSALCSLKPFFLNVSAVIDNIYANTNISLIGQYQPTDISAKLLSRATRQAVTIATEVKKKSKSKQGWTTSPVLLKGVICKINHRWISFWGHQISRLWAGLAYQPKAAKDKYFTSCSNKCKKKLCKATLKP